jgi:benzoylformate decarboxylase
MSARCSFPEDHPLFAGFLPPVRRLLTSKLAGYDVVLVLGAPIFTYHVESEGPVVPAGTQLFQITDDAEAASWAPVGTSLLATPRLGLSHLLELVESATRPAPPPLVRPPLPEKLDPLPGPFVLHTIAEMMPEDAVIVEEAPSHRNDLHDYLPIRHSDGFYTGASGGLGHSLPAAVGISLADPTKRIICLLGDGSSMYSVQGLWTAAQHRLPITFIILNNQEYAALKSFSRMFNTTEFTGVDLPGIDICTIARGFGCEAARIEKACDLAPALTRSFTSTGPAVFDVVVDRPENELY